MISRDLIKKIKLIIFDFDGTLHRGEVLSLPIFKKCLASIFERYKIDREMPSEEEILIQFGEQVEDIYPALLKTNNTEILNELADCVEKTELAALNQGDAELYPGTIDTLENLLQKNYKLALCTNARKDYFNAIVDCFNLDRYFELMYAAGLFPGKDKTWMVGEILKKLKTKRFAFVGDRIHDIDAAKAHNGFSIGCQYGFGKNEVQKADIVISEITELLNIFN